MIFLFHTEIASKIWDFVFPTAFTQDRIRIMFIDKEFDALALIMERVCTGFLLIWKRPMKGRR